MDNPPRAVATPVNGLRRVRRSDRGGEHGRPVRPTAVPAWGYVCPI